MTFIEIAVIVACVAVVGGVIATTIINRIKGQKTGCCDCSCCDNCHCRDRQEK